MLLLLLLLEPLLPLLDEEAELEPPTDDTVDTAEGLGGIPGDESLVLGSSFRGMIILLIPLLFGDDDDVDGGRLGTECRRFRPRPLEITSCG